MAIESQDLGGVIIAHSSSFQRQAYLQTAILHEKNTWAW